MCSEGNRRVPCACADQELQLKGNYLAPLVSLVSLFVSEWPS